MILDEMYLKVTGVCASPLQEILFSLPSAVSRYPDVGDLSSYTRSFVYLL